MFVVAQDKKKKKKKAKGKKNKKEKKETEEKRAKRLEREKAKKEKEEQRAADKKERLRINAARKASSNLIGIKACSFILRLRALCRY